MRGISMFHQGRRGRGAGVAAGTQARRLAAFGVTGAMGGTERAGRATAAGPMARRRR